MLGVSSILMPFLRGIEGDQVEFFTKSQTFQTHSKEDAVLFYSKEPPQLEPLPAVQP